MARLDPAGPLQSVRDADRAPVMSSGGHFYYPKASLLELGAQHIVVDGLCKVDDAQAPGLRYINAPKHDTTQAGHPTAG